MRKYRSIFLISLLLLEIISCSENRPVTEKESKHQKDTMEIIRDFIHGLWSIDSGNRLVNEGYYFKPDGSVDLIASEMTGFWKLPSPDSLKIIFSTFNEEISKTYLIDSLSLERMVLRHPEGNSLLRKVPFGMNNEGVVLQGFSGKLGAGENKEYSISFPSTKKIRLLLNSSDSSITFNIFDKETLINPAPTRDWSAIIVNSTQHKVIVSRPKPASTQVSSFDLKLISY